MPNPDWDRQRREIESYNTFYASFTGRASNNSFSDKGYFIRGLFVEIDSSNGENPEPDFVLYDGEVLLLVEVKKGDNIEPRHIDQMKKCLDLTILDAQEYLTDNRVREETPYDGNVDKIEPCIVYSGLDESYIDDWRGSSKTFRESIEELEKLVPILGQRPGEKLRVLSGSFNDPEIQSWLSEGIQLPLNPKKEFYLTDGMEKESIAVAICQIWGQRAVKGADGITVTISDVRERFEYRPPSIPDIVDVFQVLENIGACDQGEKNRQYIFKQSHMRTVLDIERIMNERSFSEYQQQVTSGTSSEDQAGMGDFSNDGEETDVD